jgi:hypothetical protein
MRKWLLNFLSVPFEPGRLQFPSRHLAGHDNLKSALAQGNFRRLKRVSVGIMVTEILVGDAMPD